MWQVTNRQGTVMSIAGTHYDHDWFPSLRVAPQPQDRRERPHRGYRQHRPRLPPVLATRRGLRLPCTTPTGVQPSASAPSRASSHWSRSSSSDWSSSCSSAVGWQSPALPARASCSSSWSSSAGRSRYSTPSDSLPRADISARSSQRTTRGSRRTGRIGAVDALTGSVDCPLVHVRR